MAFNKQRALTIINPVIGVLFVFQAASGIFHDVIPYEVFEKLHGPAGFLLAAGVITHIILNRNWFKSTFAKRKSPAA